MKVTKDMIISVLANPEANRKMIKLMLNHLAEDSDITYELLEGMAYSTNKLNQSGIITHNNNDIMNRIMNKSRSLEKRAISLNEQASNLLEMYESINLINDTYRKLGQKYPLHYIICSELFSGTTYVEIQKKYSISSHSINNSKKNMINAIFEKINFNQISEETTKNMNSIEGRNMEW